MPMPVLGERENRISQQTRVQLNQFTKLTDGRTIQQLHMPKGEGKGVREAGSGGRLPGSHPSLCPPGNSPGLQFPYLNT